MELFGLFKPIVHNDVISSVGYSDAEIINNIRYLHLKGEPIDLDPTYSTGIIYRGIDEPRFKFDLSPQSSDVVQACCTALPVKSNSIKSILFDPPFIFGEHGQMKNYNMVKRFTKFKSFDELRYMYKGAMKEFYRVLKKKGILIFKCQDFTDTKTTITHNYIINWAQGVDVGGFYVKDLFILVYQGGRIYNPAQTQRHARKFHCYYLIMEKLK